MHPEPSESSNTDSRSPNPSSSTPPAPQHGSPVDAASPDPSLVYSDETGIRDRSGSEWSLSQSPSAGSPGATTAGLSPLILPSRDERVSNALDGFHNLSLDALRAEYHHVDVDTTQSGLFKLPEEILFHVISHLSASDMLNIKLVSRRFFKIVSSPIAWMHAFAKFFPGPDALKATADSAPVDNTVTSLRSDKRNFTRLSAKSSWKMEYLLRTKLLRCLTRGRPALPFAAPVPGRANRGYATAIFGCHQYPCVDRLHVDFGDPADKRRPTFLHGQTMAGTVALTDRRGKIDSWGMLSPLPFKRSLAGVAKWGVDDGNAVGLPNSMDLTYPYGMIYGEGVPDGKAFFISTNEKHGRYLAPFLSEPHHSRHVPRVVQENQSTCCVLIAKSLAIHRLTQGLVGLLAGSSNGILSAYSLGSLGVRDQRRGRGELAARWAISPGVPIIAVAIDNEHSIERHESGRIWAVALNALGEVYYTCDLPEEKTVHDVSNDNGDREREASAWGTGRTVVWRLLRSTAREARDVDDTKTPWHESVMPENIGNDDKTLQNIMPKLETSLAKRPADIRAEFRPWDMRRTLNVDFAADDGKGAGEVIVVCECGFQEGLPAAIHRYTRTKVEQITLPLIVPDNLSEEKLESTPPSGETLFGQPSWSFPTVKNETTPPVRSKAAESLSVKDEWHNSNLTLGRYKNIMIQVTAMDSSTYAVSTLEEDQARFKLSSTSASSAVKSANATPPGDRARFFAVGTGAGTIFVWNIRAPASSFADIENTIHPLRVIHTQSLSISALALSSLYIVHGGPEGLVQAWDPLASSTEPIRTLSARTTLNARRRAAIANRTAGNNQNQAWNPLTHAVAGIALDPDPTVLRGAITIGTMLRYFSYSSSSAEDGHSAAKNKARRAARGLNSGSGGDFVDYRKNTIHRHVNEELAYRAIVAREAKADAREERRLAGRYGLNLLGEGATEEDFVAYAKLLSQEEDDKRRSSASRPKLSTDASVEQVEMYKSTLSPEDYERWKYASWQERFEMPSSELASTPRVPTASGSEAGGFDNREVERAIEQSLGRPGDSFSGGMPSHSRSIEKHDEEESIAEAIRQSLNPEQQDHSIADFSDDAAAAKAQEDEDLAKALSLSMQESSLPSPPSSPPSTAPEDDGFPALGSSPSTRALSNVWSKGKRRPN